MGTGVKKDLGGSRALKVTQEDREGFVLCIIVACLLFVKLNTPRAEFGRELEIVPRSNAASSE